MTSISRNLVIPEKDNEEIIILEEEESKINWKEISNAEKVKIFEYSLNTASSYDLAVAGTARNMVTLINNVDLELYKNEIIENGGEKAINYFIENVDNISAGVFDSLDTVMFNVRKDDPGISYMSLADVIKKFRNLSPYDSLVNVMNAYHPTKLENAKFANVFWYELPKLIKRSLAKGKERLVLPGEKLHVEYLIVNMNKSISYNSGMLFRREFNSFPPLINKKNNNFAFIINVANVETVYNWILSLLTYNEPIETYDWFGAYTYSRNVKLINSFEKKLEETEDKPRIIFGKEYLNKVFPLDIFSAEDGMLPEVFGAYYNNLIIDYMSLRSKFVFNNSTGRYLYYLIWLRKWVETHVHEDGNIKMRWIDEIMTRVKKMYAVSMLYNANKEFLWNMFLIEKNLAIKSNVFKFAIKKQFGISFYEDTIEKSEKDSIWIWDTLKSPEYKKVEKYIENVIQNRTEWLNNKCPHFALRKEYDDSVDTDKKFSALNQLMKTFAKDVEAEPDTKIIYCNNCSFNLGCEHEKLMLERYHNQHLWTEITTKLIDMYATNNTEGKSVNCKFCGRKLADADFVYNIEFDSETKMPVYGSEINKDTKESQNIMNNIRVMLIYAGLSGKFNQRVIYNEISTRLNEIYDELDKKRISSKDLSIWKKAFLYVYVFAYIANEIANRNFTYNFPKKYMKEKLSQEDRNKLQKGSISPYNRTILEIIKQNDKKFLSEVGRINIPIINYLKIAYKFIRKNIIQADPSEEKLQFLIRNNKSIKPIIKKIPNIKYSPDDLKWSNQDILFNQVSYIHFTEIFKYMKVPISNRSEWKKYFKLIPSQRVNKLFVLRGRLNVPLDINYTYFPQDYQKFLIPHNDLIYTPDKYELDGSKIDWKYTKIEKKGSIETKVLKTKLGLQKKIFDMGYELFGLGNYYNILDGNVNVINLMDSSREKFYVNSQGKTKTKDTTTTNTKYDEKQLEKVRKNSWKLDYKKNIKELVDEKCDYLNIINVKVPKNGCNDDTVNEVMKIMKKLLERKSKSYTVSKSETIPLEWKNKLNVDKKNHNIGLIEKIIRKIKNERITVDVFLNLGKFVNMENYSLKKLDQLKSEINKIEWNVLKDSIHKEIKTLHVLELINIIDKFVSDYRLVHVSDPDLFNPKAISEEYLKTIIKTKKDEDFKIDILKYYDSENISALIHDEKYDWDKKAIILLNVFANLIHEIIKSREEYNFLNLFMVDTLLNMSLIDITQENVDEIENKLDSINRLRRETNMNLTMDEKFARGILTGDITKQLEILDDIILEQEQLENENAINNYNEEEEYMNTEEDDESKDDLDYDAGAVEMLDVNPDNDGEIDWDMF